MVDKKIINKLCKRVDETTGYEQNISAYWKSYLAANLDLVEVVRCKDCKHRKTENCSMYVECDCGSQYTWECDNDFCSYGERKCEDA